MTQDLRSSAALAPLKVVALAGSPTRPSRSTVLLRAALAQLADTRPLIATEIEVRELPAQALLGAEFGHPAIVAALAQVQAADVVIVATPIYKAAYSGVLKSFLDLLPQDGLRGKTVLPLGTGGSLAHLLALDYALKPVLSALGARHVLDVVYAEDRQFSRDEHLGYLPEPAVLERLQQALSPLRPAEALRAPASARQAEPASC